METRVDNGYYITIPTRLLHDDKLKLVDLIVYGMVANLSNQNGYCFATNKYISTAVRRHEITVSKSISNLVANGYLNHVESEFGQRHLYLALAKTLTPLSENAKHNKQILITNNNKEDFEKITPGELFMNWSQDELFCESLLIMCTKTISKLITPDCIRAALWVFINAEGVKPQWHNRRRDEIKGHFINWLNKKNYDQITGFKDKYKGYLMAKSV